MQKSAYFSWSEEVAISDKYREEESMEWIKLADSSVEITLMPVSWADYVSFVRESGRQMPSFRGARKDAVTGVSAKEANAFAEWLSRRDGQRYRLPTLDEMKALADQAQDGLSIWPCWAQGRPGMRRLALDCLSEWLNCVPEKAAAGNHLHCMIHPPWLRNNHGTAGRGALTDGGYPFMTFRLVRIDDTGRGAMGQATVGSDLGSPSPSHGNGRHGHQRRWPWR